MRLTYGVGLFDKSGFDKTKEYSVWSGLLRRCYSSKWHAKRPSYIECTASENFKKFSYFYDWCQSQIGFHDGFYLDKDLIAKGNKIYSENTCVFVPVEINNLILNHKAKRGVYPIGVSLEKKNNRLRSEISINGKRKFLGYYDDPTDAFNVFRNAKEKYIKDMAEKYKDRIDPRVYNALLEYKIEITD